MPPPAPNNRPGQSTDDTALLCPGCGYNLRGVCTPATPTGHCSECGQAFRLEKLQQYWREIEKSRGTWVIIELICYPIGLALLQGCLGCAGLIEMDSGAYFFTPIDLLGTPWIVVPILGAALASGLVASHAGAPLPPHPSTYARERRRATLARNWVLFFVLELVLFGTYIFMGCGAFL